MSFSGTDLRDKIDPAHLQLGFMFPGQAEEIWKSKYRWGDEATWAESAARIVKGVYAHDNDADRDEAAHMAYQAMINGLWMPAGRILAGAGTGKRVTLINCFVNSRMEDSMESIMQANTYAALTMQQGGGMGTDFSPLRPEGALLKRTHTKASGPLPFMHMWDAMCRTIRSAGDRRGAMMGTICDTHPDLLKIIEAKQTAGALTNFNLSILISDAFMDAKASDAEWTLYFHEPPVERAEGLAEYDFLDADGVQQYVYSIWRARELWERITRATYVYSEPGIIFIDRINQLNNLHYCEEIRCTNPCGEQPLPPHGACDLGHVNLARLVRNPFMSNAAFDYNLLRQIVTIGVRFLDNVIEATGYPLPEQEMEQHQKRRLGLGFTGLADVFAQLRLRYGSMKSADIAERIQQVIAEAAYLASIDLVRKGRKPFPLFDADKFLAENTFAGSHLDEEIKEAIRTVGIRNSLLLTVAPTGTTTLAYGNPGSGLEPFFANVINRKVLQGDGSYKQYRELSYSARLFASMFGDEIDLPSYFVTMSDLTVHDHILIQSRVQEWVDASVSKTINLPESTTYEEFVAVYDMAYTAGCKGCTTYRPSEVRGSILTDGSVVAKASTNASNDATTLNSAFALRQRPKVLDGRTYKIKWPRRESALYLTINSQDGVPFEAFITSKDGSNAEWTTALTLMITAIFRKGGDFSFIPYELKQIQSVQDGAWVDRRYFGSLPAYIGHIIEQHLNGGSVPHETQGESEQPEMLPIVPTTIPKVLGKSCPHCSSPTLIKAEGCDKCTTCGFSHCG